MSDVVHTRSATLDDCASLAPRVAALPLWLRYGQTAASLRARWQAAIAQKDGEVWVASRAPTSAPLGLCWFYATGTFGSGAYLRLLVVDPAAVDQGIGTRLLHDFETRVYSTTPHVFILCSDVNHAAQAFYQGHGYTQAGVLPSFTRQGLHEWIFYKHRPADTL